MVSMSGDPFVAEDGSVILNIQDFGAIGDGKFDNRVPLEMAYAAAVQLSKSGIPATIYVPSGTYWVNPIKPGGLSVVGNPRSLLSKAWWRGK